MLHDFISAAYWRSAAFIQLRMLPQADEQTNNLLKFAVDKPAQVDASEHGLIHYARGRYYLETRAAYDAITCFEKRARLGQHPGAGT